MWNSISTSKLTETRIKFAEHQKHRTILQNVRTVLDNKAPFCPDFLKNRQKQKQMKFERDTDIDHKNQLLLGKMLQIERHPAKNIGENRGVDYRYGHVAPETIQRNNFFKRVQVENKNLFMRMNRVQSNYSIKKWDEHRDSDIYMQANISTNGRRGQCVDFSNVRTFSRTMSTLHDSQASPLRKSASRLSTDFRRSSQVTSTSNLRDSSNNKIKRRPYTAGSVSSANHLIPFSSN